MNKPKKSLRNSLGNSREFLKYTNVAFRMIVIILGGVFAGVKLDAYFEMERSIFTMILAILSVSVSMYIIIKEMSKK